MEGKTYIQDSTGMGWYGDDDSITNRGEYNPLSVRTELSTAGAFSAYGFRATFY